MKNKFTVRSPDSGVYPIARVASDGQRLRTVDCGLWIQSK